MVRSDDESHTCVVATSECGCEIVYFCCFLFLSNDFVSWWPHTVYQIHSKTQHITERRRKKKKQKRVELVCCPHLHQSAARINGWVNKCVTSETPTHTQLSDRNQKSEHRRVVSAVELLFCIKFGTQLKLNLIILSVPSSFFYLGRLFSLVFCRFSAFLFIFQHFKRPCARSPRALWTHPI